MSPRLPPSASRFAPSVALAVALVGCVALDPDAERASGALGPDPCADLGSCVHVDLTTQTLRAYDHAGVQYLTTTIASGRPQTPTRPGTYHVWLRVANQWMSGPGYNVYTEWVQYFDEQRALHSADWLAEGQYGQPQSHGCVNMRNADAKLVWDRTSGETPVIVTAATPGAWCPDDACAEGQVCGTATPAPCRCGDGFIQPGVTCESAASTGGDDEPAPNEPVWCPNDRCADGQRCGTATDDPCECDGAQIGPGAICVFGAADAGDFAPSGSCLNWQCDGAFVCVEGAWRSTSCSAEAGVDRVCRAGWCDWP